MGFKYLHDPVLQPHAKPEHESLLYIVFKFYEPQGPQAAIIMQRVGENSCLKVCEYTTPSPLPTLQTVQTEMLWFEWYNLCPKLHHFLFLVSICKEN